MLLCCFRFLFPLAAAMNFGNLFLLLLQKLLLLLLLLLLVPGWENTMPVKDGEAPKLHHVTFETTAKQYSFRQFFLVLDQLLYHCLYNET